MIFSLSALWWRRIRGLWKLPDGRDWLRVKLDLVLMGGAMFSKSLIQKIDALELWCWRRLLRVPWTEKTSSQSILKEISPEYSLEGLMLNWNWSSNTLATWYEELTYWKRLWCWERLREGEGDNRGWDDWMASPTRWTWVWVDSGSWWWTGRPDVLQFMGSQRVGHDWATELNWTNEELNFQ